MAVMMVLMSKRVGYIVGGAQVTESALYTMSDSLISEHILEKASILQDW
jgi:hypothetical protein